MISILHDKGFAVDQEYHNLKIVEAIYKCARANPDDYLLIYDKNVDINSFKDALPELNHRAYFISNSNTTHRDLGYVEDGPFLKINPKVTFPTWLKGTAVVCMHAQLVNSSRAHHSSEKDYLYWLNSLGKLSRLLGVLNYQIPYDGPHEVFRTISLYKFVKQHYKTRWIYMLLFCHIWYEKRFPILAFIKAHFYKKKSLILQIEDLQNREKIISSEEFQFDVVIPTMGRASYLKNVLEDLNIQKVIPNKVIIIEQNADKHAVSELGFLKNKAWGFEIIHEFSKITGACRARNRALSISDASWVLLFDDDVRIKDDFTAKMVGFIKDTSAMCLTFSCLQEGEVENQLSFKQWESFGAGCSLVHRDIIENCHFNMALEHGYGEDVDYGMQIRNAGYDVIYAPQIQIQHLKAPVGGFRKPHVFPWHAQRVQPKPSPQIMYFRKKNFTNRQVKGYKITLFFKYYLDQSIKNPFTYFNYFKKAWKLSLYWSNLLAQDAKS
jgi:GT2 family glycosyltransferase